MFWRLAKAVLILPGTVVGLVPVIIQWVAGGWPFGADPGSTLHMVLAVAVALPAIGLAVTTMRLFVHEGQGTPAPWDPPQNFVVRGPYRYVRNPMILSVIGMLLAEALALASLPLLGWAVLFFGLNTIYFAHWEEPGLQRRFGAEYDRYKETVPRWAPRLRPYTP